MSSEAQRPRLLVIASGEIGERMAGNAIRSFELARALAPHAEVTLTGISAGAAPNVDLPFVAYEREDLRPLRGAILNADAVLSQPLWPLPARWVRRSGARLISDLYDPEPFEVVDYTARRRGAVRRVALTLTLDRVIGALRDSHHVICASEKQRDLWLGTMLAERLIDSHRYEEDRTLRQAIDVVPFGVPAVPPEPAGEGLRAHFPQIGQNDPIVLWNGGIWSWLDAPTAIRAVAALRGRHPGIRLVFMGASEQAAAEEAAREARQLARELDLLDNVVFFHDTWVPYEERGSWLLDADCALSAQADHLETRFAFRTRLLDCFWAGLPVVCTAGDDLATQVERDDLGATAPEGDHVALAKALEQVLERGRDAYSERLAQAAAAHHWDRVIAPVARWLAQPRPPRRIGDGSSARPGHAIRSTAFAAGHGASTALGLRIWPRL